MVCAKSHRKIGKWVTWVALLLFACSRGSTLEEHTTSSETVQCDSSNIRQEEIDSITNCPIQRLRISAVGDIMLHDYQMRKAYRNDTDTFDFSPVFQQIQPYLDEADLLIGNLETVFGGKKKGRDTSVFGYGTFPYFNAPDCFATTLSEAGFDWLATANNHILDAYPAGITRTLNLLDSLGIAHHGTSRDSTERQALSIIEKNGIKVGLLSYTHSLNGIHLKKEHSFMVNEYRKYDSTKVSEMCAVARRLREAGADFTIAYLHCGTEYQRTPNRYQRRMADSLHKAGCDLILMSHPHILQRLEIIPPTEEQRGSLVAYSLGNFLSSQVYSDSIPKDIGAILEVTIRKDSSGTAIDQVSVVPTYTYWRKSHIGILPVIQAYNHPDSLFHLYKRDKERVKDAFSKTLITLRGKMDSTLWSIDDDRYLLKW